MWFRNGKKIPLYLITCLRIQSRENPLRYLKWFDELQFFFKAGYKLNYCVLFNFSRSQISGSDPIFTPPLPSPNHVSCKTTFQCSFKCHILHMSEISNNYTRVKFSCLPVNSAGKTKAAFPYSAPAGGRWESLSDPGPDGWLRARRTTDNGPPVGPLGDLPRKQLHYSVEWHIETSMSWKWYQLSRIESSTHVYRHKSNL